MPGYEKQSELFIQQQRVNDVRLLSMQCGKVKKAITQGLRAGSNKGVCSAIVNHWILSGVDVDADAPKQRRREFRQNWSPGADMPKQFIEDQQKLDQFGWMKRKSVKTGFITDLNTIANVVQTHPEDDNQSSAYFFLNLYTVDGSDSGHAIGLKRGKIQKGGVRFYSLLDPNYFEVTHICNLLGLLEGMKKFSWYAYFKWEIVHVTKKEKQPPPEEEFNKRMQSNKTIKDLEEELAREYGPL